MIKKSLKTLLTFPLRVFRRWTARREMAKLVSHESPKLKAVGNALREAFSNVISVEERMVISSIEQRRAFLLSSDDRIAVVDYGAGRSDSKRTKEEMKKGVQTTESVSKICEFSELHSGATLLFQVDPEGRAVFLCANWALAWVSLRLTKLLHSRSLRRENYQALKALLRSPG